MDNSRLSRIVTDPKILAGKPHVRGSRFTVEAIVDLVVSGLDEAAILAACKGLQKEDIRAVLLFVSRTNNS